MPVIFFFLIIFLIEYIYIHIHTCNSTVFQVCTNTGVGISILYGFFQVFFPLDVKHVVHTVDVFLLYDSIILVTSNRLDIYI